VAKKKPYFIPEPFGLPFELTQAGEFRKLNIKEWQDIKDLDAQIRTIIPPKKKGEQWEVKIGLQESLGEQGGDTLTQFYDEKPTLAEIRKDIIDSYKEKKKEINEPMAMGVIAKSGRDEMIEKAIDIVLKKKLKEVVG